MPGKVKTSLQNYLSDQKDKVAEYQRNGGSKTLYNKNFELVVNPVAPTAEHRTIELIVSGKPAISSLAHLAGETLAIIKIAVNATPSGDEIEKWLYQSYESHSATITINMTEDGGWARA